MFMQHVGAEDWQLLLPGPNTCGSLCPPPLLSQPPSTTVSDVRTGTEVSIIDAHRVCLVGEGWSKASRRGGRRRGWVWEQCAELRWTGSVCVCEHVHMLQELCAHHSACACLCAGVPHSESDADGGTGGEQSGRWQARRVPWGSQGWASVPMPTSPPRKLWFPEESCGFPEGGDRQ